MDYNGKIIRNVSELPTWYNLDKYQDAPSLDAASWYELILQRWTHFYWFEERGPEWYRSKYLGDGINPRYSALLQSRDSPLYLLTDGLQIVVIGGGQLEALKYDINNFSTLSRAVAPLTFRRLYRIEQGLKVSTRKRIRKWMDRFFNDFVNIELTDQFKAECEWANSFINDPISDVFEKQRDEIGPIQRPRDPDVVQIDLSVPDKILIQQFTDYLRHVRQKYPDIIKANKYKYPEYQKWIDYAVLPYLDLKLWAEEEGCSIPNRVMADAIFPDGEKGEEMVRKTTKKIADTLMKTEYVGFLATIAAHEIAEKNSMKFFRQK